MTDEELRRKIFIKAAGEVAKVWPGHAAYKFPEPTNRTDQCLFCDLKFRLAFLIRTWKACRLGKATMRDFESEVIGWKVSRIHTAEIFNLGKATDGAGVEVKKKKALEAARTTNKFRG